MKYRISSTTITNGILQLRLRPKYGSQLTFRGGQYAAVSFSRDGRPTPSRCFSIISQPGADELCFAIRLLGDFTHRLSELSVGETIEVRGPFGEAVIQGSDRDIVLLAAGIGITPMLSLLHDPAVQSGRVQVTLLYSCHSAAQAILARDVWQAAQKPNVRIRWFFSRGEVPPGLGAQAGRLNETTLDDVLNHQYDDRRYIVCGPSDYTNRFVNYIRRQGVADTAIVTESFAQVIRLRQGRAVPRLVYSLTVVALLAGFGGIAAVNTFHNASATAGQSTTDSSAGSIITTNTATDDATTDTSQSNDAASLGATTGTADSADTSATSSTAQTYQQPMSSVS